MKYLDTEQFQLLWVCYQFTSQHAPALTCSADMLLSVFSIISSLSEQGGERGTRLGQKNDRAS